MDIHEGDGRHTADDCAAFAAEAVERSEHAGDPRDRLELLARAQAWAMLAVAQTLTRIAEALAARKAFGARKAGR